MHEYVTIVIHMVEVFYEEIYRFSDTMPNRKCDFCNNGYKSNPGAGYYKVTDKMRDALDIHSLSLDYVCGEHFDESCFELSGRLRPSALPTFFPRTECVQHDHPYTKGFADQESNIGKTRLIYYFGTPIWVNLCNF